jgi:hypothetical protein
MAFILKRLLLKVLIPVVSVFLGLFVLFSFLEIFPGILDKLPVDIIPYYAQKRKYLPDEELVLVPRKKPPYEDKYIFKGDLYLEKYQLQAPVINYLASYGTDGFRNNSSQAPYEVVLIGDSYLEFGESDDKTLSEQLKALSGFRTRNLGREWYGPYQYLKIMRHYTIEQRPRFVLFCFFSGNDIRDIHQYDNWRHGDDYYHFVLSRSFLSRFQIVLSQVAVGLEKLILNSWRKHTKLGVDRQEEIHSDIGFVRIGNQEVPMRFCYWNPTVSAEELLTTHDWIALRKILADFQVISYQQKIVPVIVYIPHTMEVYADLITERSGITFRKRLARQIVSMDNSVTAFRRIAAYLSIDLVDLTPAFRAAARKGELLYYPFDTHWTLLGRQIAARLIGSKLREIESGLQSNEYRSNFIATQGSTVKVTASSH